MSEQEVKDRIRAAMDAIGSLRAAAKVWGVTPSLLSDTVNGKRRPGAAILSKIGVERVVTTIYREVKK